MLKNRVFFLSKISQSEFIPGSWTNRSFTVEVLNVIFLVLFFLNQRKLYFVSLFERLVFIHLNNDRDVGASGL